MDRPVPRRGRQASKRSRLPKERIIGILKKHRTAKSAGALCRKHGISETTLLVVGLTVSPVFASARFATVLEVLGIPVLGNPALHGIVAALAAIVLTGVLTKTRGRAEEVMAGAHRS